jgi:guanine deaminase
MNEFMAEAVKEARKGLRARHGGPFGAIIVKDGVIIARTHNKVLSTHDPTSHAEINAIRLASRRLGSHDLSDCIIYSSSEPCPMCYAAIKWARIKQCFYGCTRADTAKLGFSDKALYDDLLRGRPIGKQLDRDECLNVHDEWLKLKKRELY